MPIEKVVFYSKSDREQDAGKVSKLTIDSKNLTYIMYNEMGFKALYGFLNAVGEWVDVEEEKE